MPTWKDLGFTLRRGQATCMICRRYKVCNETKVVRYGRNPSETRVSWFVCNNCWKDNELVVYNP